MHLISGNTTFKDVIGISQILELKDVFIIFIMKIM